MTPEEAVTQLRVDLADPRLPNEGSTPDGDSLWSDVELYRFLNKAQEEFSRRTRCFPDSSSFTSTFVANDKFVILDRRIIDIRNGYLTSQKKEVRPLKRNQIGQFRYCDDYGMTDFEQWRELSGVPTHAVTGMEPNKVRLLPYPTYDDTIEWEVWRLPTAAIEDDLSEFEVDEQWHETLLLYAKYLAYMKQDVEVQDTGRAVEFKTLWDEELRERAEPFYDKLQRGAGVTRYGGIY